MPTDCREQITTILLQREKLAPLGLGAEGLSSQLTVGA
jgi:hypothetical protein